MRDIVILGSTGSIGVQALEVIAANPTKFRVVGLSAGANNLERLVEQVKKFSPLDKLQRFHAMLF